MEYYKIIKNVIQDVDLLKQLIHISDVIQTICQKQHTPSPDSVIDESPTEAFQKTKRAPLVRQQSVPYYITVLRRHVAGHSATLHWFRVDHILHLLIKDAANTNFIVIGLTQPGLEPTIYHTPGEHARHYATDVVSIHLKFCMYQYKLIKSFKSEKHVGLVQSGPHHHHIEN
jgi:hypothetical protein